MAAKSKDKPKNKRKKKPALTAKSADRHVLYQLSVQAPEEDSKFMARYFKKITGRPLRHFREDFCGTAFLSCEMVRGDPERTAIGVDIHGPTLRWGEQHNLARLTEEERARVTLLEADVLEVREPQVDLICALNFSYGVFKTRELLGRYLRGAFESLADDGVFMLDVWGGSETQVEQEEEREIRENGFKFTYIWDQRRFDPLHYHIDCRIHFEFPDGSRMKNAFRYQWRIWTVPELRELMLEAGFRDVHVLWEGSDKGKQEGNGVFRRVKTGEADPAWIAYVVGVK